jgi:hypothetical protein
VTDRQAEQGDRQAGHPAEETSDRAQRAAPQAPERHFPIPEGPVGNETEAHFRWRVRATEELERNWQQDRRWEAVRNGQAQPASNHQQEKDGKPSAETEVERGEE